jgi:hypothetical protein
MKEIAKVAFQGDCAFVRVKALPRDAKPEQTKGSIVVAHSETGHHHSIDKTDGVTFFTVPGDPLVCYLQLDGIEYADVVHHRPDHTHETVRLLGAIKKTTTFQVRRQREYTPEGWRQVQD